jgi:phenylalanyl-tRNA synthetase alpha subunit
MTSLSDLISKAASDIDAANDLAALDAVRVAFLGKKGEITVRLKTLGQLPAEERSAAGQEINKAKQEVQERLNARRNALEAAAMEAKLAADAVDVTLPGRGSSIGGYHPVTRAMLRIEKIFRNAGFGVRAGPEIEDDFHNFTTRFIFRVVTCCERIRRRYRSARWSRRVHRSRSLHLAAFIGVIRTRRTRRCFTRSKGLLSTNT